MRKHPYRCKVSINQGSTAKGHARFCRYPTTHTTRRHQSTLLRQQLASLPTSEEHVLEASRVLRRRRCYQQFSHSDRPMKTFQLNVFTSGESEKQLNNAIAAANAEYVDCIGKAIQGIFNDWSTMPKVYIEAHWSGVFGWHPQTLGRSLPRAGRSPVGGGRSSLCGGTPPRWAFLLLIKLLARTINLLDCMSTTISACIILVSAFRLYLRRVAPTGPLRRHKVAWTSKNEI